MDFKTIGLCCISVLIMACNPFMSKKGVPSVDQSFYLPGDSSLVPVSDKISTDCKSSMDFDSCLVFKNPFAQIQAPVTASAVNSILHYGIKIRGIQMGLYLENRWVQILTTQTFRLDLRERRFFKSQLGDGISYLEQLSAYYWSDRVFEYLAPRVGHLRLPVQNLKIYVDDVFTGYSIKNNSIHLQKKSGEIPKALNGEIVVQLVGQALAHQLSNSQLLNLNSLSQHNTCNLSPKGCCSTKSGCANALASSFGDYLVGIMFPEQPRLGETLAQSTNGQLVCAQARNLVSLSTKTEDEIFNSCSQDRGNVTLLGAWYASLWWKLRTQAEAQFTGGAQDIDILFFDHAKAWTATSTFASAKLSAQSLVGSYKSGIYLSLFQSVFAPVN